MLQLIPPGFQRSALGSGLAEIDGALETAKQQDVDLAEVRQAMTNIGEVYGCLQLFEQKELMQLILQGPEINEREMMLEIRTGAGVGASEAPREIGGAKGKLGFEPPNWLPIVDTFRTFCMAPPPEGRQLFEEMGEMALT